MDKSVKTLSYIALGLAIVVGIITLIQSGKISTLQDQVAALTSK